MPTVFPLTDLLDCGPGRHFAAGPHLRIQVVRLVPGVPGRDAFLPHHGDVLVLALRGRARVQTKDWARDLAEQDQALLSGGEAFHLVALGGESVVQLVWSPGANPCKECWELNNRYYADE
jgi:hypothetical protein